MQLWRKIESGIEEVENRIYNIKQQKVSTDNVYNFLLFFDRLYDKFTDLEKKTFLKSFLEEVRIYETEQEDGRILRSMKFRFPVYFLYQKAKEMLNHRSGTKYEDMYWAIQRHLCFVIMG